MCAARAAVATFTHLDEGDAAATVGHRRHLGADAAKELVGQDEDEERRVRASGGKVRVGDHVVGELDALRKAMRRVGR